MREAMGRREGVLWDGGRGCSQAQGLSIRFTAPAAEPQLLRSALTALLSVVLADSSGSAIWGPASNSPLRPRVQFSSYSGSRGAGRHGDTLLYFFF